MWKLLVSHDQSHVVDVVDVDDNGVDADAGVNDEIFVVVLTWATIIQSTSSSWHDVGFRRCHHLNRISVDMIERYRLSIPMVDDDIRYSPSSTTVVVISRSVNK